MATDDPQRIRAAKEALIYGVLSGYLQIADRLTERVLSTYVDACADVSVGAVRLVCQRIQRGQAGLNTSYPPTPADIASRAAALDDLSKPEPILYSGLIDMDWGRGRVDMRGLTVAEQDEIIRMSGVAPDGRSFAQMTLDEKRATLGNLRVTDQSRPVPVPKLKSMAGSDA